MNFLNLDKMKQKTVLYTTRIFQGQTKGNIGVFLLKTAEK